MRSYERGSEFGVNTEREREKKRVLSATALSNLNGKSFNKLRCSFDDFTPAYTNNITW